MVVYMISTPASRKAVCRCYMFGTMRDSSSRKYQPYLASISDSVIPANSPPSRVALKFCTSTNSSGRLVGPEWNFPGQGHAKRP